MSKSKPADDRLITDEMQQIAQYQAQAKNATTVLYTLAMTLVEIRSVTLHACTIAFAECYVRMFRALMKFEAEQSAAGRSHVIDLLNVLQKQFDAELHNIVLETAPTQTNSKN